MAENKKRVRKKRRHPELDCALREEKANKRKNTKKAIIAALIAVVSVACAVTIGFVAHNAIQRNKYEIDKYEIDFDTNKSAFQAVAGRIINLYNKEKAKNPNLESITILAAPELNWRLVCRSNDGREDYVVLEYASADDKTFYGYVRQAFSKTQSKDLMMIKITDDRITFGARPPYAVVYMRNDSKPDYVITEGENYDSIFVDKFADRWFQVIGAK